MRSQSSGHNLGNQVVQYGSKHRFRNRVGDDVDGRSEDLLGGVRIGLTSLWSNVLT